MISFIRQFLIAGIALALATAGAAAQDSDQSFEGETVTIYVGFGPGGGYDGYARLLASHIGSHIPGNPSVIVQNMGGAGSLTLANFLYNTAPNDGTAFGIIAAGLPFRPLIGTDQERQAIHFDPREFSWLGSIEQFTYIGVVWRESGISTLEQMKEQEVTFGSSGAGGNELFGHLLNNMLGTKLRPIRGYEGSADITLAMERGEVDAFVGWCWTCMVAMAPRYIEDDLVNVFVQFGLEPDPAMPDVPHLLSLIEDPVDRQAVELIASSQLMARPFVAPPGVPEDRVQILRTAFEETVKDPAFLEDARRAQREIALFTGEQIEALLERTYAFPENVVERAVAAVSPPE